jgi:hypothetical protein
MVKWRYSSTILDLSTRWRSVVSFNPGERALDTHWIWDNKAGLTDVKKSLLPLPGIEPRPASP